MCILKIFIFCLVSLALLNLGLEGKKETKCQWPNPNHLMPESSLTSTWTASTFKVSDSLSLFLSHMNKFCVCLILWVILGVWGWGWYMMVQNANRVRPIWIFMLNFSVIWLILNFWQIPSMPIWFFFDIKWCPLLERMRTLAYTLHGSDFWAELMVKRCSCPIEFWSHFKLRCCTYLRPSLDVSI